MRTVESVEGIATRGTRPHTIKNSPQPWVRVRFMIDFDWLPASLFPILWWSVELTPGALLRHSRTIHAALSVGESRRGNSPANCRNRVRVVPGR